MIRKYLQPVALTTLLLSSASVALAAENGGSAYPDGTESFFGGAMPPPGTYLVSYNQFYSADKFANDYPVFEEFEIDTLATVARGVYVSDKTIFGASWGMHAFLIFAHADITLGGGQDEKTAMGDLIIDPFLLGWHKGNWHVATGIDFYIPVGSYDKKRLANIGRNYYTIQPIISTTYLHPKGYELTTKWMYDINFENDDTKYDSGNAVHVDYLVAKHHGPLAIGLGGYVHRQLEDDKGEGAVLGGFKAKAASIGPQVRYQFPKGIAVAAKYQKEFDVENRPDGQKFAIDLTIPF
jgi:hypothetical protein